MKRFSIAVDGPAGSGKSTIAKIIAKELEIIYVDTGAMYRALGLYFIKKGHSLDDEKYIVSQLDAIDISIKYIKDEQHIILNGEDVTFEIRTPEATKGSSDVSKIKLVREKLVDMQRKYAETQSVIMDGRDIGTTVLPNASLKIFLTASIEKRAERRAKDFENAGQDFDIEQIKQAISKRDYQDMNRENSPLRKAEDAVEIDTTDLTIQQVSDKILALISNLDLK